MKTIRYLAQEFIDLRREIILTEERLEDLRQDYHEAGLYFARRLYHRENVPIAMPDYRDIPRDIKLENEALLIPGVKE